MLYRPSAKFNRLALVTWPPSLLRHLNMKKTILAALLVAAAPALAQTSITTLPPPVLVDPKVATLRDHALDSDHYAWDIVEGLTTEVGQRLAATDAEAPAPDWAAPPVTAMGFSPAPPPP